MKISLANGVVQPTATPARIVTLASFLFAACAGGEPAPADEEATPAGAVCIRGTLTGEGVECPAFRARDGGLYTLVGEIAGLKPGDAACVCGGVAIISFCMQGTTLAVTRVAPPDDC